MGEPMSQYDEDVYPLSDDPDYEGGGGYCIDCGGEGWKVTCCDDICRGLGYCMHGDGMQMCHCNTSCDPPSNAPGDWRWTPNDPDSEN